VANNVNMRDYAGLSKPMRTTDDGTSHTPHHFLNRFANAPAISAPSVDSLVLSAVAASLIEYDVHALANGYIFIFDATSKPANGARTPLVVPKFVPAGSWFNGRPDAPYKFSTGIVLAFSSTLNTGGAWNFTASANAIFSGQIGDVYGRAGQ